MSTLILALQTVMIFVQWAGAWHTPLPLSDIILQSNPLEHSLENWQQLDSSLLKQGKAEIGDKTDLFKRLLLDELFSEVAAETLCIVDQKVRDHNCLIGMQCGISVLVHLRVECADLHMRFALVFQHFQF